VEMVPMVIKLSGHHRYLQPHENTHLVTWKHSTKIYLRTYTFYCYILSFGWWLRKGLETLNWTPS